MSRDQTPCSPVPHFHPQNQIPDLRTRIFLYFCRLWEVGEFSVFEELRILVILSLSPPSLKAATPPSSLLVTKFPLFSLLR